MGRVYFATNREPDNAANPKSFNAAFNGPAPGRLLYGVADVAVPPGHDPDGRPYEADDAGAIGITQVAMDDFAQPAKDAILSGPDHLIVSIHGYLYKFWESAARADYLSRWFAEGPFGNRNTTIFFAWPSAGALLEYERDWDISTQSGPATGAFLTTLVPLIDAFRAAKGESATVTLLAHSMGNHAFACGRVAQELVAANKYDRTILVAADETRRALAPSGPLARTFPTSRRVYVYYNAGDIPLLLSAGAMHPLDVRLGFDGPPDKGDFKGRNVSFINASAVNYGDTTDPKDSERHQYYRMIPEVRDDMCAVMRGLPDDRIPNREYRDDPQYGWENFWLIKAIGPSVIV